MPVFFFLVFLANVPLEIHLDYLGNKFSKMQDVEAWKSKTNVATGCLDCLPLGPKDEQMNRKS